ncbi:MAG: S8 family serine peptidase [Anaerolineae bacterium]|nr:S8 family serine peptidase [Anaerolineae bacterium]
MTSTLAALASVWNENRTQVLEFAQSYGLEISGDWVGVTVTVANASVAEAVKASVVAFGGVVVAEYDRWFDAQVPVAALVDIGSLPGVSLVQSLARVMVLDGDIPNNDQQTDDVGLMAGTHLTQGVAASNANAWHSAGIDGSGVTVAVLDVGFVNVASLQSSGELPPASRLTTLGSASASHGSAVAEIVYDMAPGVNMILVSAGTGVEMASRIQELADYPDATRPDIITSSIHASNLESGDGTGLVSDAITYAVSKGILFTQAAGNSAQYNWQGTFSDPDGNGWLNFSGTDEYNDFYNEQVGDILTVDMRWNAWPVTDQDYDLYLKRYNSLTGLWDTAASSLAWQSGSQSPTESISFPILVAGQYAIAIHMYSATGNHVIDIMGYNTRFFEYNMTDRSLVDPATPVNVFGVAALNVMAPYNLEYYSSRGPGMGPGGSLATGNAQPRIAGYANVDTATWSGFNGTSSATPHVAGAAALVWDAYPSFTVPLVKSFLESRAADMGTTGLDSTYGAGRLYLGAPPVATPGVRDGIGIYARATGDWYLRTSASPGSPSYQLIYGGAWATPVVGDWDGDGIDSVGVYDPSNGNWYLRNTNNVGAPNVTVNGFGGSWGLPVSGDWDGNGIDTIGLFVPTTGEWQLRNSNSNGIPDLVFAYGGAWGYPLVGDWDGDGDDSIGIYNPTNGNWYLRNSNSVGGADIVITGYGGWWGFPIVGDWDGDGKDTIGLFAYQTGQWLLRNTNTYGPPDIDFVYGGDWGTPLTGDWNGPGTFVVDLPAFNADWDAVSQAQSAQRIDSVGDLLRFPLDHGSIPEEVTTSDEAVMTATPGPFPTAMETMEIKSTPLPPMATPQAPESPAPIETSMPPATADSAAALPDQHTIPDSTPNGNMQEGN